MQVQIDGKDLEVLLRTHPSFSGMNDQQFHSILSVCAALELAKLSEPVADVTIIRVREYGPYKVPAIKFIRHISGLDLKTAKDAVEAGWAFKFKGAHILKEYKSFVDQYGTFGELDVWTNSVPSEEMSSIPCVVDLTVGKNFPTFNVNATHPVGVTNLSTLTNSASTHASFFATQAAKDAAPQEE